MERHIITVEKRVDLSYHTLPVCLNQSGHSPLIFLIISAFLPTELTLKQPTICFLFFFCSCSIVPKL